MYLECYIEIEENDEKNLGVGNIEVSNTRYLAKDINIKTGQWIKMDSAVTTTQHQ